MNSLNAFKAAFPQSLDRIPLNNAGMTPLSLPALKAIEFWANRLHREGEGAIEELMAEVSETRTHLAKVLNCESAEIAFFPNTASAISQVALGLALKAEDELVVLQQEYPSNFYPWRLAAERAGARLIVVPNSSDLEVSPEQIKNFLTPRTKLVATSWIQYRTGAEMDLKRLTEICRPRGIFTCVDIIQGAGVLPFDFKNLDVDAACGGGHKWHTSPFGIGYLALKSEHIESLNPVAYGAMSFGGWNDLADVHARLKPTMERFEPGAKNALDLVALGASLKLQLATGALEIQAEAQRLSALLQKGLRNLKCQIHSAEKSLIVNFTHPTLTLEAAANRLKANKISFALRPPGIRLSPHAFNSDAQIAKTLQVLS